MKAMHDGSLRASVVVGTRDRAFRLARTLRVWEKQLIDAAAWELIVVDNASTDDTTAVAERFQRETMLRTLLLRQPRGGLCAARNAGWRQSRGRVVAFVDDDCYPAEDFLAKLLECFAAADLGFVGGRMPLYDASALPLSVTTQESRRDFPPRSVVDAGLIHGGNMAFRRDVLEAIGGFDERLGAGTALRSGGDVDALSLASAAGFAGAYDPRPVVLHDHGRTDARTWDQVMAGYDIGRGGFFFKCLADPGRRWLYAWPIARRVAGHLLKRRFATLRHEFHGAALYARASRRTGAAARGAAVSRF